MTPIQTMESEHRLIESVVRWLGNTATAIEHGQRVEACRLERAVEFFRVYADQLHHGKEEALLFPMLVKRGVPPGGCPIGGLNHEHEKGRALVQTLAEQARAYGQDPSGTQDTLLGAIHGIVELYRHHIWKEDAMVFPMADRILTPSDQSELREKFAEVDSAMGLGVVEELEQFAGSLGVGVVRPVATPATSAGGCGCGSSD